MGPYFVLGDQLINLDQVKTARRVPGDWDHKVVINNELSINFGSQSNNELETLAKALNARHHEKEVGPTERKVEELEKKVNCLWNMPGAPGFEAAKASFEAEAEAQRTAGHGK